jgi:hypothetical protein
VSFPGDLIKQLRDCLETFLQIEIFRHPMISTSRRPPGFLPGMALANVSDGPTEARPVADDDSVRAPRTINEVSSEAVDSILTPVPSPT